MNEKKVAPAKKALFSSREKGLVLEHHSGSICARACLHVGQIQWALNQR